MAATVRLPRVHTGWFVGSSKRVGTVRPRDLVFGVPRLLPEQWKGWLDVYRPAYRASPDDAFNGQQGRRAIVEAVITAVEPDVLVETGTYKGSSTEHLARRTKLPVHSVEASPRFHGYSRHRLRGVPGVHLQLGDSRSFLRELGGGPVPRTARPFFYLDAHWGDDLPLAEELQIIESTWTTWAVMVDDFQVTGDAGYLYDDYGPGKALTVEYAVSAGIPIERLHVPTLPSSEETGARHGCTVIGSPGAIDNLLAGIPLLRRSTEPASTSYR